MSDFESDLPESFGKAPSPDIIRQRADRAAQSILENERLTADLDDGAANVLLDWAIACVQMIAKDTAGLDDKQAEPAMSPRLRATRRLMRGVNKWITRQQAQDVEGSAKALDAIMEQAAIIYNMEERFEPDAGQRLFNQQAEENPAQKIAHLRAFIEQFTSTKTKDSNDD